MALSKIELEKIKAVMDDPVKWAQVFVTTFDNVKKQKTPWIARWYQAEMLRDRNVKKVARCGRRIGKCLLGDVEIFDPTTGENIPVKELYERQRANLVTLTGDLKLEQHFTNIILDNGIKDAYELTLKSGKRIKATGNHPFYTLDGWVALDDLKPGDMIATPEKLDYFGSEALDEEEVIALAYMLGDGISYETLTKFINPLEEVVEEMKQACLNFETELVQYENCTPNEYILNDPSCQFKTFLIKHDLYNVKPFNRKMPSAVFKLPKEQLALFISRLYTTNGWVYSNDCVKPRAEIGYATSSYHMAKSLQHLLLRFGIHAFLMKKQKNNRTSYQLMIRSKKDLLLFSSEIGIFGKEEGLEKLLNISKQIKDLDRFVPKEVMYTVEATRERLGLNKKDLVKTKNERLRYDRKVQISTLKAYNRVLQNPQLQKLIDSDLHWEEITSIRYIGKHQTYDLSVPLTNSFVANDIITHNTETMCIEMLWKAFTMPYHRILVVTPYENQVRLIFTRLNELISDSPLLKKEVVRNTKNPYWIELKNGAIILGFTTGASSGSGGASIRGQRADSIYMDEVDYMGENDFDSVMAIAGERPDISIFMSSTPTGARSKFWAACKNPKMGFKEFHHPSTHNPNWGPEMEAEFRAQLSEQGYVHEILAEFGTQETGVFNKDKVDLATKYECYTYNPLDYYQERRIKEQNLNVSYLLYDKNNLPKRTPFRTMGVDWDKYAASSSIIILDYDVISDKFKVIKRVEVPRGEYSYDNAVNLIIELNEIFSPSWIYCDAGAGEYQIERLRIYGDENPSSGLKNKIKRWQFKQHVELTDPVTGEIEKAPAKTVMINQLQIAFERERMILSEFDEVLYKQLIDYEVERISRDGTPVFTNKNEHFVDALGLAYLAFVLEFSQLVRVIKKIENKTVISHSDKTLVTKSMNKLFHSLETSAVPEGFDQVLNYDPSDLPGDRPTMVKVPTSYRSSKFSSGGSWGSRSSGMTRGGRGGRSMW